RDLLARMARGFASSTEALAEQLRSLPAEESARALHGLKGVAGNLGARRVADMAGQGEQQLRQGRPLEPAWIEALEQQRLVASQTLQSLIQTLPSQPDAGAPASAPDKGAARQALLALSRLLRDSDMAALDALEALRQAHGRELDEAALEALDRAVTQLDFALAERHCAALLDTLG
ncbi:MAG: Hpt domain-containing protein, partial [Roseateles sp.]